MRRLLAWEKPLAQAALDLVSEIPRSHQVAQDTPKAAAQALARKACRQAALASGTLALAPGPWGLLTVLPDLLAVWKIQAQLVADIAAVYGQKATLTREHMLSCLFRHTASQAVRDLVVRSAERYLMQRAVGSSAARFLPVVGAVGVGGYAYYDTRQVAAAAVALFEPGGGS
jgi:uncharacterized protein (DUF697 family)